MKGWDIRLYYGEYDITLYLLKKADDGTDADMTHIGCLTPRIIRDDGDMVLYPDRFVSHLTGWTPILWSNNHKVLKRNISRCINKDYTYDQLMDKYIDGMREDSNRGSTRRRSLTS